ncbi:unnamed protein product [Caenorhabditis auriculariae]|uniref:Uncharacterized protein n=1 Tax=Caenorhabditis auriculariae TaxID=2777116 RepID=A0A8S1HF64_9PELO|nr:unnamed protein product [Caenorhabditis auriculariae]
MMKIIAVVLAVVLTVSASRNDVTESSDIRQSSAQAVAPSQHVATSPHPFSRQIVAPSRNHPRVITPVPTRGSRSVLGF